MKRALLVVVIGVLVAAERGSTGPCVRHVDLARSRRWMTSVDLGKGKVTIDYGTPKLGARNLDEMIKPGVAWLMAMNNPTTLETTVALDFAGKKLAPGKYAIFARPDEQRNWTLLVSSAISDP